MSKKTKLIFEQLKGVSSGGSEDWTKGVANIKYSYCFELRPGQSGTDAHYGFALPASRYVTFNILTQSYRLYYKYN